MKCFGFLFCGERQTFKIKNLRLRLKNSIHVFIDYCNIKFKLNFREYLKTNEQNN